MSGVEFDPYQGRRRASVQGPGDRWLLTGLVLLAMLALGALVVIVANGPQRPRSAPPGGPGIVAAPSMVGGSPTDPPSPTLGPSPGPASAGATDPGTGTGTASPVRRRPSPSPVTTRTAPPVWSASYEAEARERVWRWRAWVGPMAGASGGRGVFGLGQPTTGALWFWVSAPRTDRYTLTVWYQNPDATARYAFVTVDRGDPVPTRFAPTGGRAVGAVSLPVILAAGDANSIQLTNPYGRAPDLDRIVLTAVS